LKDSVLLRFIVIAWKRATSSSEFSFSFSERNLKDIECN